MLNSLLLLLGQAQVETPIADEGQSWAGILLSVVVVLAVLIVPFFVGRWLAKTTRMPDYGTRLGVILFAITAATAILLTGSLRYGVDLKGGVILIYQIDASASEGQEASDQPNARDLIQPLSRRINPSGTKEIVVRPYGEQQVEIIVPDVDPVAIDVLKKKISTAGALEFRIVADPSRHDDLIQAAEAQSESPVLSERLSKLIRIDGKIAARWVPVARDTKQTNGVYKFKTGVSTDVIRNPKTGEILSIPQGVQWDPENTAFEDYLREQGIANLEVLMAFNDGYDVKGNHLAAVRTDYDSTLNHAVAFTMNSTGAARMGGLTRTFGPEDGRRFRLGIILDEELLSAPSIQSTISDRGQITGNFTQEEVEFLVSVLRAGRLPAVLEKQPISESQIDPTLGLDTIRKGGTAIGISLATVLVFILIYYRFSGIVACAALLLNLLLILATMVLLQAPLTLPGLAGLVLTVGMSVDANVLIFERIREELDRGSALRMAIRNGFARATTTIVDANITTLITAIVLYAIGTDQVRGFAVTLILGILMSMFTAIYCSRAVFDIAERVRWISKLAMMRIVGATQIDFMGKTMVAGVVSAVLITVGLVAVVIRGADIFDIDFRGGSSATMVLNEPMSDADVRARLADTLGEMRVGDSTVDYTVARVDMSEAEGDTVWKVDSSIPEVKRLQAALRDAFDLASYDIEVAGTSETVIEVPASTEASEEPDAGAEPDAGDGAATETDAHSLNVSLVANSTLAAATALGQDDPAEPAPAEDTPAEETPAEDTPAEPAPAEPAPSDDPPAEPAPTEPAPSDDPPAEPAPAEPAPSDDPPAEPAPAEPAPSDDPPAEAAPTDGESSSGGRTVRRTSSNLTFGHPVNAPTLRAKIREAITATLGEDYVDVDLVLRPKNPEAGWTPDAGAKYAEWTFDIALPEGEAQQVLQQFEQELESTPVWQSSSVIGGKVAGDTQSLAIAALLGSLLGIIAYIWVRFQRVVYGLAAVAALVHDVLITLGAIAISYWLASVFGFLLIEEFKISLPVVAAFLTIIGYSLNDTIVVFDRIREVRGKSPTLTGAMINSSINQTLSRTLLTSITTLIVVLILYVLGGQGIHGFAFSLVIGVMVGTYSSIFIASPVLLWMSGGRQEEAIATK